MRPPASEPENRTHGAKKNGPSQYSDFFNKIGQTATSWGVCVTAALPPMGWEQWAKTRRVAYHEQGRGVQLADYFLRHMRARLVDSRPPSRRSGSLFSEGNFPDLLGAGRFAKIGIPYPDLMGPFVGAVETICGALIILGLFTRLASIPLIVIMIVAIVSTKVLIFLGQDFWIFHLPKLPRYGFWSMMHEARDDFADS